MNWKMKPFSDFVFFQEGPGLRNWQWTDEGMKVINVKNILGDGVGSVDTTNSDKYVSLNEFESRYKHFEVQERDIVVASSGNTYGKVGRIEQSNLPLMMNTSVIKFRSINEKYLNNDFLFCFLRSSIFKNQVEQFVTGGAQPNFGPSHVKKMSIPIPSISEQEAIGFFISQYDQLLQNNKRRIELLEESARQLYKEWFVRFRFPGHEHVKIIDGVPEGWTASNLGSFVNVAKGKNITRNTVVPGDIPVVAGGLRPAYYHNKANTIGPVITVSASGANAGFVRLYQEDVWASDCSYIESASDISIPFYYLMLKERQPEITSMQKGSAQPHVYPKDLMRLTVVMPPKTMLQQFTDFVVASFNQIKALEAQNKQLYKTRDLLLPKLMSGEIAV